MTSIYLIWSYADDYLINSYKITKDCLFNSLTVTLTAPNIYVYLFTPTIVNLYTSFILYAHGNVILPLLQISILILASIIIFYELLFRFVISIFSITSALWIHSIFSANHLVC